MAENKNERNVCGLERKREKKIMRNITEQSTTIQFVVREAVYGSRES